MIGEVARAASIWSTWGKRRRKHHALELYVTFVGLPNIFSGHKVLVRGACACTAMFVSGEAISQPVGSI